MGYSTERKQAVLRKLLPPYNRTVADLVKEEGVSTAAIYQWRKAARAKGQLLPENSAEPEGRSTQDKFNAVLETAALAEAELAEYCRRRGLYSEQIRRWRAAWEQANDLADGKAREDSDAMKTERQRSEALERELRRKEAALAETAALLALREKAAAIWGGEDKRPASRIAKEPLSWSTKPARRVLDRQQPVPRSASTPRPTGPGSRMPWVIAARWQSGHRSHMRSLTRSSATGLSSRASTGADHRSAVG